MWACPLCMRACPLCMKACPLCMKAWTLCMKAWTLCMKACTLYTWAYCREATARSLVGTPTYVRRRYGNPT